MEMRYLKREEIDEISWNKCLDLSINSLIYGYTWYLDAMTEDWNALILGDYEAVFPLPFRKKWGIQYLYQPPFTQQLGVFSQSKSALERVPDFFSVIPKKFKYWDIQVNALSQPIGESIKRTTYHLALNKPYDLIANGYSKDAKKSIRKANAVHWELIKTADIETIILDYTLAYGALNVNLEQQAYQQFKQAIEEGLKRHQVECYFLIDGNGERMASGVFFRSKGAVHYNLGAPTVIGRSQNATHVLIDKIIQSYANQDLVLDFEGSEIPSVAYFYKKFGVYPHHYFRIKRNHLPFPLSLLKK